MTRDPILLRKEGGVARITLSRPPNNVIDDVRAASLRDACQDVIEDDVVTVVVLTGSGAAFCVDEQPVDSTSMENRRVADAIAAIPKPTVAALNGDALGHGLEIALACDLRVAVDTARLGLGHVSRGELPWDGGTQRLPRLAPRSIALEMLLTGRVLSAHEALACGLVTQAWPASEFESRTNDLARKLAASAPIAARYAKEAIHRGMDVPLEHGLRLETDLAVLLHTTADRAEGIGSFLKKGTPKFRGQ